jgi:dienelactone hydrolase
MPRIAAALAILAALAACAAVVSGASTPRGHSAAASATQRVEVPKGNVNLRSTLVRPAGNHRFPAVVVLGECRHDRRASHWLPQLQARGFAAISVGCGSARSSVAERSADAFAALAYLRSLSYVSPDRIAVLGWSSGATAALAAVGTRVAVKDGFRAAVAFAPNCSALGRYRPAVSARVLTTPRAAHAASCKSRARRAGKRFSLSVYRNAARKRGDAAAFQTLATALASVGNTLTIFDPDSWVTAPLLPNAPLDPDQSLADRFRHQIQEFGTWVNTTQWSTPLYVVGPDQPRVQVNIDSKHSRYNAEDQGYMGQDFASVPLPADATSADPPENPLSKSSWIDHELIVYQPSTDTAWELYHLLKDSNGKWWATAGGKISNVSHNMGNYDPWPSGTPHGMTGYAVPMLAGLQRLEELGRGTIDHVVGVSIPHPMKGVFRSPGLSSDGEWTVPDAVPEGTRFRLPADLNIDALPLTPYAKIVAKAIQAHGLVIVDRDCRPTDGKKCPAVTFKAEDPRPKNPDPYAGIFGNTPRDHLFDNFPWDKLQVLAEV